MSTIMATESPRERGLRGRDTERMELPMPRKANTLLERFMAKVELPEAVDGCWVWTAATAQSNPKNRYGKIWAGHRSAAGHPIPSQAHRVAYELFVGPIPEGLEIDHLCRNTLCVNPAHLEAVTYEENQRRGQSPMAKQARQTHCKRGHPLDHDNTYRWKTFRRCRRCNAEAQAEIRKRRRG